MKHVLSLVLSAFVNNCQENNFQSFSSDDFGDETMAAIRFGEEFSGRYGQPTPHFFPGSLDQAIRESCLQPAKDVRHT